MTLKRTKSTVKVMQGDALTCVFNITFVKAIWDAGTIM